MWTLSFKDVEVKDVEVSNLLSVNENNRPLIPIIVVPNSPHQMFPNHIQYIFPSISSQSDTLENNNNAELINNETKQNKLLSDGISRFPHNFIGKNIKLIECKSVSPMQFFNIQDADCNNTSDAEFANSEDGSGAMYDERICESALLHESSKNVTLVPDLMAPILKLNKDAGKKSLDPISRTTNVFTPIVEMPEEDISQEEEDIAVEISVDPSEEEAQDKGNQNLQLKSVTDKESISSGMSLNGSQMNEDPSNTGDASPEREVKLNREDFDLLRPRLFLNPSESLDVDLNPFMDPLIGSFTFFSNSASPKKFLVSEEENLRIRAALLTDVEKDSCDLGQKKSFYQSIVKKESEIDAPTHGDSRLTPAEDSDDILSSPSPGELGSETVKPFSCEVCSATFNRLGNYTRHKKVHLSNSRRQYPRFECEECGKSFIQRCDLTRHQHIHSGTEPHRCNLCGKGYIRHSDLVIHQRFHNKEKPFNCPQCGKGFSQRGDLNRHVRSIHLQGKPMACSHCRKKFVKESSLARHIQAFHSNLNIKSVLDSCNQEADDGGNVTPPDTQPS